MMDMVLNFNEIMDILDIMSEIDSCDVLSLSNNVSINNMLYCEHQQVMFEPLSYSYETFVSQEDIDDMNYWA